MTNGKVLVVGGTSSGGSIVALNSAELYDPNSGTWSVTADMLNTRQSHTATLLPNGTVIVAGGFNDAIGVTSALSSAETYNPNSDSWSSTASINNGRYGHTATRSVYGTVIVTGGFLFIGSSALSSTEVYTPTASLSYYTLPACRIVDTRNTGTLNLPIGSPIAYKVNQGGSAFDYSSQGGSVSGCGIPADAKAVFFNFVAVNASGSGYLQAWPVGSPIPTASVLNYANVPNLNIANGIIPVCNPLTASCTNDLNVQANQASVQLVMDIVGYFK
jgi:hypothetical protein